MRLYFGAPGDIKKGLEDSTIHINNPQQNKNNYSSLCDTSFLAHHRLRILHVFRYRLYIIAPLLS